MTRIISTYQRINITTINIHVKADWQFVEGSNGTVTLLQLLQWIFLAPPQAYRRALLGSVHPRS